MVKVEEKCTAGEFVTIDEKLETFRGRCSYRQYISQNPAKYGNSHLH